MIGLKRDDLQFVTHRQISSVITCDLRLPSDCTKDIRYSGMMRRANYG
jgi:hypothetical protein